MSLRHKLIRLLSCGDMILLNTDISNDGTFRSRNAGPMLVAGVKVWNWSKPCAVGIGPRCDGALHLEPYGRQGLLIADSVFDRRQP